MVATIRPARPATLARWQAAAERAVAEGVRVAQVNSSGLWIATSGSDATVAYELEITGEIAHSCSCPAGQHGDPVCKHRAAFYLAIGTLELDPEPTPPAPAGTAVIVLPVVEPYPLPHNCPTCTGTGWAWDQFHGTHPCTDCAGRIAA